MARSEVFSDMSPGFDPYSDQYAGPSTEVIMPPHEFLPPGQPATIDTTRSVMDSQDAVKAIGFDAPVPALVTAGPKRLYVVDVRQFPADQHGFRTLPDYSHVRADFMIVSADERHKSHGHRGVLGIRQDPVSFGRNNDKVKNRFDNMAMLSGDHFSITPNQDGSLSIVDTGSKNGTALTAHRMPESGRQPIVEPPIDHDHQAEVIQDSPEQMEVQRISEMVSRKVGQLRNKYDLSREESQFVSAVADLGARNIQYVLQRSNAQLPKSGEDYDQHVLANRNKLPNPDTANQDDDWAFGIFEGPTANSLARITGGALHVKGSHAEKVQALVIAEHIMPMFSQIMAFNEQKGKQIRIDRDGYLQENLRHIMSMYNLATGDSRDHRRSRK